MDPIRTYLNANNSIFVEPVGTDSKAAQLTQEANQHKGLDGNVCESRQEAAGRHRFPLARLLSGETIAMTFDVVH